MKATMKNKYSELILSPISLQSMSPRGQVSPLNSKARESVKGVPSAQWLWSVSTEQSKEAGEWIHGSNGEMCSTS